MLQGRQKACKALCSAGLLGIWAGRMGLVSACTPSEGRTERVAAHDCRHLLPDNSQIMAWSMHAGVPDKAGPVRCGCAWIESEYT